MSAAVVSDLNIMAECATITQLPYKTLNGIIRALAAREVLLQRSAFKYRHGLSWMDTLHNHTCCLSQHDILCFHESTSTGPWAVNMS